MTPAIEFEIHIAFAADSKIKVLANKIHDLGFRDDKLVGRGVVNLPEDLSKSSCPLIGLHVTWDTFSRREYHERLAQTISLLEVEAVGYSGYMHAEVIRPEWDCALVGGKFSSNIPFPLPKFHPASRMFPKKWDVHISAQVGVLDERVEAVLYAHGFYSIDLIKLDGSVARVFTVQGISSSKEGQKIFRALKSYLIEVGGIKGSIKFEQTCYFASYGEQRIVPPTIGEIQF